MKRFTFSLLLFLMIFSVAGQNALTLKISYVMNKSNPPSYSFSTDFKGEAVKCIWYFGDEGTSEKLLPTYTFKYTKNYGVQVKIVDNANNVWYGKTEGLFEGANILTTGCKAMFTWAIAPFMGPSEENSRKVAFSNKSTGTIKTCTWTFGDETRSTELNPIHTYAKYGEYKVCLIIETTDCCKSDFCTTVKLIDPNQPVIQYGKGYVKDLSAIGGCKWGIVIDNTTVLLPLEMAMPFEFKAGQKVELAYELLKNTATVCMAGKPVKVHKIAEIPVSETCKAYFTATNALWSDPSMMKKMVFANLSTGEIKACKWTFGDGTSSTDLKPVHEYPAFGEYRVCLSIETTSGCKSEYCAIIKVSDGVDPLPCSFDLIIKPKEQSTNTFLFYAISKQEIKSWKWIFGDGQVSDAQNPSHTFEKPGVYEVKCTITTATACTVTKIVRLTVQAPALPQCPGAFSLLLFNPSGAATVCNGKAVVTLMDENIKPYKEVKYFWSHGATGDTVKNLCPNKQYIVQAVIAEKCQKSASFSFLTAPVMKIEKASGTYIFSVVSPEEDLIYRWEFGDGKVAYGASVENTFDKEGNYDVKLTAISGDNSSTSEQKVAVLLGTTSLDDMEKHDVKIYPNPVRERVWIDFSTPVSGAVDIDVIDMKGRIALVRNLHLNGQHYLELDTQTLNDGIYFLRVNHNGQIITGLKFLKQK